MLYARLYRQLILPKGKLKASLAIIFFYDSSFKRLDVNHLPINCVFVREASYTQNPNFC